MRVDAAVARPVGDGEGAVVEDRHETRGVAARAAIGGAVVGRGGGDQDQRRHRDEAAAVIVERRQLLVLEEALGFAVMGP